MYTLLHSECIGYIRCIHYIILHSECIAYIRCIHYKGYTVRAKATLDVYLCTIKDNTVSVVFDPCLLSDPGLRWP